MNVPSFIVKKGDAIVVREKSQKTTRVLAALEGLKRREVPQWLESDATTFTGKIRDLPSRDDVSVPMEERLIVELYSK